MALSCCFLAVCVGSTLLLLRLSWVLGTRHPLSSPWAGVETGVPRAAGVASTAMLKMCDHNFIDKRGPQTLSGSTLSSNCPEPQINHVECKAWPQGRCCLLGHTGLPGRVSLLVTEESNYIQWVLGHPGSCYFREAKVLYPLTHGG